MASVRKSLALSFAQKYSSLAIGIVSTMILARLLTPAEIGIYSVGAAVAGFAQVLRDFGVGNYLIQEKELTRDRIRAAFGVTLAIAWPMAAVLYGASGPVAAFYGEPGVEEVLGVLALTLLVIPFNAPVLALLRRDMAFGAHYVIGTVSGAVQAVTSVTLAAYGVGFMSLAWGSLAGVLATAALAAIYRPRDARILPGCREWRRVVSFGGYSSASAVVAEIGMSANDLILGRLLGFAAVGLYSRAQGLVYLFHRDIMSAIRLVAFPALASTHREGGNLKQPYLQAVGYVTALALPFYGFLGVMAYPIVRILFGSQWDAAVPIVQILSIAGAIASFWTLSGSAILSMGHVKKTFVVEIIVQPARVAAVVLAAPFGLEAVAVAHAASYVLAFFVFHYYLHQLLAIRITDVLAATGRSMLIGGATILAPVAVSATITIGPENIWIPFALAAFGAGVGWVAAVFATRHPLRDEALNIALILAARMRATFYPAQSVGDETAVAPSRRENR